MPLLPEGKACIAHCEKSLEPLAKLASAQITAALKVVLALLIYASMEIELSADWQGALSHGAKLWLSPVCFTESDSISHKAG